MHAISPSNGTNSGFIQSNYGEMMGHTKGKMIVEAKVLYELQRGSFEELLQSLDREVSENQDLFGKGDSVLFATHPDNVVVLNEGGVFFNVPFKKKDGVVKLGKPVQMKINTLSESDVATGGVESFYGGGSVMDSLRGIINLKKDVSTSPLEKVEAELAEVFSGGKLWRKRISESSGKIGSLAWDAKLGSLKIDIKPVFADLIDGDEPGDEVREDVVKALLSLEGRLSSALALTKVEFDKYQKETNLARDEELDITMSQFDSFAGDYIDHLGEIMEYVSLTLRESKEGCVLCTAFVHDEVAKRFKDLEMGGRFIRKVSSQLQK